MSQTLDEEHGSLIPLVIKAIGNNEEQKGNHSKEHKILMWKTLSNKER
jgi:hypothetical protein